LGRAALLIAGVSLALGAPLSLAQVDEAREAQRRGVELHRSGDLQGALREFDRVIGLVPASPFAWYNRGLVRRDLKDCHGAIVDFSRALELAPGLFNALYQRGNCLQARGDYAGAIDDYTRAVAQPGQIHGRFLAYFARGDAFRRLGRLEEAHADYTRVAELRTDTTALRSRAWVNFCLGRWSEAYRDAARYLHDTEAKEPDAAYALILGALALRRQGQDGVKFLAAWEPKLMAGGWPRPVMRYLKREIGEADLLQSAKQPGQRTEALAYVGASLLADGKRERGIEILRRVLREGDPGYLEYDLAYHELRRLGMAAPPERRERKPIE
jgi:tetratricopeptide (TPR) repeat protein